MLSVDTKEAGAGELEVVCEAMGERRVRMPVDVREDGHTYRVRLRPSAPAHYRIYITYGGNSWFHTNDLVTSDTKAVNSVIRRQCI